MAFLKKITFNWEKVNERNKYPFNIPAFSRLSNLDMNHNVLYFVGENGSGKSTLLEAIAFKCGFGNKGGGKYNINENPDDSLKLDTVMTLSWMPKVNKGFFVRAETFFDFACYIDDMAKEYGDEKVYQPYGGVSLNMQSHGEAFLSLFTNRFGSKGFYILDEPEAALSPQRQLTFMRIIYQLEQAGQAQFVIATHSPILMAYPNAVIYDFDSNSVCKVDYENTEHYRLIKAFLNNRERFLKEIFEE